MSSKLNLHPAEGQIATEAASCVEEQLRRIATSGALVAAIRCAFYRGVRAAQQHPDLAVPETFSPEAE